MTAGSLTAELRGRQWIVRDESLGTVAWIAPAAGRWYVSYFDVAHGPAPGPFGDAKTALEAIANALEPR